MKKTNDAKGSTPRLGNMSTAKGLARPGVREAKQATAPSVAEANGKLARPGGYQAKPPAASGSGLIARPGGNQGISGRGVNGTPTKNMQATTDG